MVAVVSGFNRAGSTSKFSHVAAGRTRFLTGCWTGGLDGFWTKATPSPGHVGVSIWQLTSWQLHSIRATSEKAKEDKHSMSILDTPAYTGRQVTSGSHLDIFVFFLL